MNRRAFLVMVGAAAIATPALADHEDDIIERLTEEGYDRIDVTRTLLGRVRIVAFKGRLQRELVLNPRTGEILRDIVTTRDDGSSTSTFAQGSKSGSAGSSGSSSGSGSLGSSGSNSGSSGSSGSGSSGSGDSGSGHDDGDDDHSGKGGGDDDGDD